MATNSAVGHHVTTPTGASVSEFFRKFGMLAPGISKFITSVATAFMVSSGSMSNAAVTRFR